LKEGSIFGLGSFISSGIISSEALSGGVIESVPRFAVERIGIRRKSKGVSNFVNSLFSCVLMGILIAFLDID
jgi:hypothetical protein